MSSLRDTPSKTRSRSASVSGDASGRGSRPSLIPRPPTSSNHAVGPSQGDRGPTQEVSPVPAALVSPSPQEGSPLDANIVSSIAAHVEQNLLHRVATQVEKSLEELHTSVNSLEERIYHLEKQNPDLGPAPSVVNEVITLRKDVNSILEKGGSRPQNQGFTPVQFAPPLPRSQAVERKAPSQGETSLNLADLESRLERMEDSTRHTGGSPRAKRKTKKPIRLDTPPSRDEESDDSSDDESSDVTVDRVPRKKYKKGESHRGLKVLRPSDPLTRDFWITGITA